MWIVIYRNSFWCILNTVTKKSKKIGRATGKGTNYYDRATEECLTRNLRDYGKEVNMIDESLYDRAGNYVGMIEGIQVPHNLS